MNRRSFIKMLFVSAVGLAGMRPKKAFGESTLTLTQDVVYDFTNRVIDTLSPIKNLSISKLNKFCEVPGKTAGYIVDLQMGNIPHGYIIIDKDCPGLLSEFNFEENSVSPACELGSVYLDAHKSDSTTPFIKMDSLNYGLIDISTGNIYSTLTGLAGSNALKEANPASYDPGSWEDATVSWEAVHSDYQVKQESSVDPFRFISESTVESKAKKYACVVSSLYAIGQHYGIAPYGDTRFNTLIYNDLWNRTKTSVEYSSNGINYGTTPNSMIGPGFVNYAKSKNVNVSYIYNPNSPSPQQFIDSVNRKSLSTFMSAVFNNGSKQGHCVTVQGYMTATPKGGSTPSYFFCIFDGWYSNARWINYRYKNFLYREGVFFK